MPLGTTPSPGLDEELAELDRAARGVLRSWLTVLAAACLLVVLSAALVVSTVVLVSPLYVPVPLMVLAGTIYNVTRFVPRSPRRTEPRVDLSEIEVASLLPALTTAVTSWRPTGITLTAETSVWIDPDDRLEVGYALLTCFATEELQLLVGEAVTRREVVARPPVRRAIAIAHGEIGRWIRDGGPQWFSRMLLAGLDRRIDVLLRAHARWLEAHESHLPAKTSNALLAIGELEEAWWHLVDAYLVPAAEAGREHAQPFAGLRSLLVSAQALELVDARFLSQSSLALAVGLGPHEAALSPVFGDKTSGLDSISWSEHATLVSVPAWRRTMARGVTSLEQATGMPTPATLHALLDALERGWGTTVAGLLMSRPIEDEVEAAAARRAVLEDLVAAAVALAALESPGTHVRWVWPHGAEVVLGQAVVPQQALARAAVDATEAQNARSWSELRAALREHDIEDHAPIWLDGGTPLHRDSVVGSFVASRKVTRQSVVVVVSRSAVRIVDQGYTEALGRGYAQGMHGPAAALAPTMEAVFLDDTADAEEIRATDIVSAELASIAGGIGWRLRIRTADRHRVLYGAASARDVAKLLGACVGDRLATWWIYLPRWVDRVRFGFSLAAIGLSPLLVVGGVYAVVTGQQTVADSAAYAAFGVLLFLLAFLPDELYSFVRRRRGARLFAALPSPATRDED